MATMGEKKKPFIAVKSIYVKCLHVKCCFKQAVQRLVFRTSDHFHLPSLMTIFTESAAEPAILSFVATESPSISVSLFQRAEELQYCIEMSRDAQKKPGEESPECQRNA